MKKYYTADEKKRLKAIPILDVARMLGIVMKKNNQAMCFSGHDKETPSLTFYPETNSFYCFGCAEHGDVIALVIQCLQVPYIQACEWLSEVYFSGKPNNQQKRVVSISKSRETYKEEITQFMPDIEIYNHFWNMLSLNGNGKNYCLQIRKLTMATIEKFGIKSIEKNNTYSEILSKKFGVDRLEKCGLIKKSDFINGFSFAFKTDAIVIPFYDRDCNIIYFQARSIYSEDLRYINMYGLKKPLFNIQTLNRCINGSPLIICEGVFDAIQAEQFGFKAIACLGSQSFRSEWFDILSDYNIHIIPDRDPAGDSFAKNIKILFNKHGKVVNHLPINLPDCKDLDDVLKRRVTI